MSQRATSTLDEADGGFAAADALVALMILSTTVVLSLGAMETATRAGAAAAESQRATTLLRYLLDTAPISPSAVRGVTDGFDWSLNVTPSANPSGIPSAPLCIRTASLRDAKAGRTYQLADEAICPPKTS